MVDKGRREAQEEKAGAPEWMVTFSDCMTLLLMFFVLLLSFSSFDERVFWKLRVIYCKALPMITLFGRNERDSLVETTEFIHTEELNKGSEKPTLEKGKKSGTLRPSELTNLYLRRLFLVPSEKIFWGQGTAISKRGQELINTLALLLRQVPGRIVVSENGPDRTEKSVQLGLERAWTIVNYLSSSQKLDRGRFSISVTGTSNKKVTPKTYLQSGMQGKRKVEILLLPRSIYN